MTSDSEGRPSEAAAPIREDELMAYVDDRLPAGRRAEVERYLERNPAEAARIADHLQQAALLRGALAPLAARPIPAALDLRHLIAARRRRRAAGLPRIAAALVLVGAGVAAGWFGHAQMQEGGTVAMLGAEAAATYALYSEANAASLRHAVADRAVLASWASAALGRPMRVPDLSGSGFRFVGGQVVPTTQGPAMAAIYENEAGDRILFQARPMQRPGASAMTPFETGAGAGFAWESSDMGYGLIARLPAEDRRAIANGIRDALAAPADTAI